MNPYFQYPHSGYGFGSEIADNLNAVNDYFNYTKANTPKAAALQSDWYSWWVSKGNPSNYLLSVPDSVWAEAQSRRNAFNLANAVTPEAKQVVQRVIKAGMPGPQKPAASAPARVALAHAMSRADYAAVQTRLNALGASPRLVVDGLWGPKSKAAMRQFQQSNGLQVDGLPNSQALAALNAAPAAQPAAPAYQPAAYHPAAPAYHPAAAYPPARPASYPSVASQATTKKSGIGVALAVAAGIAAVLKFAL